MAAILMRVHGVTRLPGETYYPPAKLVTLDTLDSLRSRYLRAGLSVVWTNGCFDLFHAGHAHALETARRFGDVLFVGVNSDSSARELKGKGRPVVPCADRVAILSSIACVDYVLVYDELTACQAIKKLKPDVYCKGREAYRHDETPEPEHTLVLSYGGRVEYPVRKPELSTTETIFKAAEAVYAKYGLPDELPPRNV